MQYLCFFFLPLSYHIIFPLYPHSILLNLTGWVTDLLICCDLAAPHLLHQLDCQGPLARRSARLKSWRNSQLSSDENPWWVNSRWLYIYLSLSIYIYILYTYIILQHLGLSGLLGIVNWPTRMPSSQLSHLQCRSEARPLCLWAQVPEELPCGNIQKSPKQHGWKNGELLVRFDENILYK